MPPVLIGQPLTLEALEEVAWGREVAIDPEARAKMDRSREAIDAIDEAGDAAPRVYGVNTGFGALAETRISVAKIRELQLNLVRSHSTGVGNALPAPVVRAMMVLRAQVLALGHSGVRPVVADALCALLNAGIVPRVPEKGSVGASGDLAPLAHLALVLIGEGEVLAKDEVAKPDPRAFVPAGPVLRDAGIEPIVLQAKEGLALINGTQFMAGLGALLLLRAERLARVADLAGAMSLEGLHGSTTPFDPRLHALRPHPGQTTVAENLRRLLSESAIAESHKDCNKVQDAYSLRCMPQVHGASRDAFSWIRGVLEREVNSATDNPSVFLDAGRTEILSGGNFHGQPLALALDLAAMAAAELGNISERRVEQLVNPALSSGLTPFLAKDSGVHSGFMIAQVTSASLVSENKIFCHPASVDSIPSSAGKEDHVSMGSVSALKLRTVLDNLERILAIEVLAAGAAIDQRSPVLPSRGVHAALKCLRTVVPPVDGDRALYLDMEQTRILVAAGDLIRASEAAVGPLR